MIIYKATVSKHIETAAKEAIELASFMKSYPRKERVWLEFNGIHVQVYSDSNYKDIRDQWYEIRRRRSEERKKKL